MAKRALCVGIDQFQAAGIPRLQGCVNDARAAARVLTERFGFSEVKDLLNERATKENLLRALDWLIVNSQPGDQAVLFLSTYGSWLPDRSGNDADGLDEVFLVYDHNWQWNALRDDELAQALARFPAGVSVLCAFDTCHSGAATGGRYLAPPQDLSQVAAAVSRRLPVRARLRQRRADDLPGCVVLTACAEQEVAGETSHPSGTGGTFSLALLEALGAAGPDTTWAQVHAHMVKNLQARGFRQTPQLHAIDTLRNQPLFAAGQPAAAPAPSSWGAAPPAPAGFPSMPGAAVATAAAAAGSAAFGAMPQPAAPLVAAFDNSVVTPVDAALGAFNQGDYTVKLCDGIFKVLPFVPGVTPYAKLGDAVRGLYPQASPQMLVRAQEYANSEPVTKTLWVASAIDTGDAGIAVFSGLKSAVSLFMGKRGDAFETDPQQAVDAALKLMAMGYMVFRLFPGSIGERVQTFYALPAGQSLSAYYAAIEVALPFADNAAVAGGNFLSMLMQRYGADAASKLSSVMGPEAVQGSQGILGTMMGHMEGVVQRVTPFAKQVADSASRYVPTAMNVADKVAGVVATGADAMPVYKYLGARLAAEAAANVGIRGG